MVYFKRYGDIDPCDLAKIRRLEPELWRTFLLETIETEYQKEKSRSKQRQSTKIKHNGWREAMTKSQELNKEFKL